MALTAGSGYEVAVTREQLLTETFLLLADTLVTDFDPIEALTVVAERCVALLSASATGIMIADAHRVLHVVAESSEEARVLELFQIQNDEGPCLDAFHAGEPVIHGDLAVSPWPRFGPLAIEAGLRGVHAFPMRLRDEVVGTLNLFMVHGGGLSPVDAAAGQALAHAATITVLQDQSARRSHQLTSQLQAALNSRVTIEQAKGALAERAQLTPDEAFSRLRAYARSTNTKLTDLATALVGRSLPDDVVAQLSGPQRSKTTEGA
ncbi:MAG: GAF and ANTAR domain-containing protein [Acidimicrobiales bacterium]